MRLDKLGDVSRRTLKRVKRNFKKFKDFLKKMKNFLVKLLHVSWGIFIPTIPSLWQRWHDPLQDPPISW